MREPDGVIGFVPHLRRPERKEGLRFRLMIKRGLNQTATSIRKVKRSMKYFRGLASS
jgi:hypothetical protein